MCTEILKTCVYFSGIQEENYFYIWKIFNSRKLRGEGNLLPVSMFLINDNRNMCTENSEHSECISHSKTHTQTIYIYVYISSKELLEFLMNFPTPVREVAVSKFAISRCCLTTKSHSVLFQTAVMNLHIIII